MDPIIDFALLIHQFGPFPQPGARGVLNPDTIQVLDAETGKVVLHTLGKDFAYGDKGRLLWVIEETTHTEYEIRFRTAARLSYAPPAACFVLSTKNLSSEPTIPPMQID